MCVATIQSPTSLEHAAALALVSVLLIFSLSFETGCHYIAQTGVKLTTLSSRSAGVWSCCHHFGLSPVLCLDPLNLASRMLIVGTVRSLGTQSGLTPQSSRHHPRAYRWTQWGPKKLWNQVNWRQVQGRECSRRLGANKTMVVRISAHVHSQECACVWAKPAWPNWMSYLCAWARHIFHTCAFLLFFFYCLGCPSCPSYDIHL